MPTEIAPRHRAVLEHFVRNRISTSVVLAERYGGNSDDAVKKLLQHLKPYVVSAPLFGKSVYYRLTPAGAKLMGAPEEIANPLGAQALPKAFGVLWFCCAAGQNRPRYLRSEFAADFPDLVVPFAAEDYFLDFYLDRSRDQTVRLGHLVIDLGGDYQKLVAKVRGRVKRWLRDGTLSQLISAGHIAVAIVVPTEEKRQAIQAALKDRPLAVWVRIEVCPDLANLLVRGAAQ